MNANAAPSLEVEGVVTPEGDLVVPSSEVRALDLTPGQRVHLRVVPTHRRRMRGVLADAVSSITEAQIAQVRHDTWGEAAAEQ